MLDSHEKDDKQRVKTEKFYEPLVLSHRDLCGRAEGMSWWVVRSTFCSFGGPRLHSQYAHGGSQPPIILILGDPDSSSDLPGYQATHMVHRHT